MGDLPSVLRSHHVGMALGGVENENENVPLSPSPAPAPGPGPGPGSGGDNAGGRDGDERRVRFGELGICVNVAHDLDTLSRGILSHSDRRKHGVSSERDGEGRAAGGCSA